MYRTHLAKPCVLFAGHVNSGPDQNSEAYEQGCHCLLTLIKIEIKKIPPYDDMRGPRKFFRWGPTLFFSPNTTKIGPSSARQRNANLMAFRWPNIECWLGSFVIFQGIRTSFAKKPYIFVIFQMGGGGGGRDSHMDD